MKNFFIYFIFLVCLQFGSINSIDVKSILGNRKLTKKIIIDGVLEYFRQRDPKGIPVLNLPEPLVLKDLNAEVSAASIIILDIEIEGLSELKLNYVNVNLTSSSVKISIKVPKIVGHGNYETTGYWSTGEGPMNVTITELEIVIIMHLGIEDDGIIQVIETEMELNNEEFHANFEGIGGPAKYAVAAADYLWGSIVVPLITSKVSPKIEEKVNKALLKYVKEITFPKDLIPLDFIIAEKRHKINDLLKPMNKTIDISSFLTLELKNIQVEGLDTLHRTHEISVQYIDNNLVFIVQMATQTFSVNMDYSLIAFFPLKSGHLVVDIDYIKVTFEAEQNANIRRPPVLRKIDIKLGNFGLHTSNDGAVEYVLEAAINIVPNVFRNTIMERVTPIIKQKMQERLNQLDIEGTIMKRLNKMEE